MKRQIPHLLLAIDLGASGTKIVANVVGQPTVKSVLMKPHCTAVNDRQLLTSDPQFDEHNVWVRIAEEFYAVGNLAMIRYNATNKLKPSKSTNAVPKICAAIGVLARKFELPDKFDLSITFVLPPAEWEQRTIVIEQLKIAVKDLEIPCGKIKPKLLSLYPYPEGMGILIGQKLDLKELEAVTVVMLGFRNMSMFISKHGVLSDTQTSNLGFHYLLSQIASKTGYEISDMIEPVFNYKTYLELYNSNPKKDFWKSYFERSLDPILRCSGKDREVEREMLEKNIIKLSNEYLIKLSDWLDERMPLVSDHICVAGGTVNYFSEELGKLMQAKAFAGSGKNVSFHSLIEPPKDLPLYGNRFDDIYSLWHQMSQRQIVTNKAD